MKLYLLKRRGYVREGDLLEMIVRAESRDAARLLAHQTAYRVGSDTSCWKDSGGSTCEGVDPDGAEEVIIASTNGEGPTSS